MKPVGQAQTSKSKKCPDCGELYSNGETICSVDGAILVEGSRSGDPMIGKTVDNKYKIVSKLGGGGYGAVYQAEHLLMSRTVAIKVLHNHLLDNESRDEFLVRFQREARTASRLDHPSAVTIHDFGIHEENPYLVMQYVEGQTLKGILANEGAISLDRVVAIVHQIASAVQEAHDHGIVHRDLKPDNIILDHSRDGRERAVVLDFGIAKLLTDDNPNSAQLTQTGSINGTPQYLSPEQARQEEVDGRSDIYSLGVIIYEMLTGDVPFNADSVISVLLKHMNDAPPRFEELGKGELFNSSIENVVLKALEKDAEKRHQSARELAAELRDAVGAPANESLSNYAPKTIVPQPAKATAPEERPSVKIEFQVPRKIKPFGYGALACCLLAGGYFLFPGSEAGTDGEKAVAPQTMKAGITDEMADIASDTSETEEPEELPNFDLILADAKSAVEAKDWDKAVASFAKAIEVGGETAELLSSLGDAQISAGKLEDSAKSFERAVEISPDFETAHANLGYVYGELQRMEDSLASYKEALRISPSKPMLHNNVGFTYFKMGKLDDATKAYAKCVQADRTYSRCYYNLADVYRQKGNLQKVIALYQIGLQLEPSNAAARNNLGETYEALGRTEEATKEYRKALEIDRSLDAAQKNLERLGRY